jgi:putative ABC transport system substrate-binding protein
MTAHRVKRRHVIAALGGALAWPVLARAQVKMAHIAYLGATSPSTNVPQIEKFKQGLVENGLVEGRNITVDYLWGEGSLDRLRQLAVDLAQRDLDAIVTAGGQAVHVLLDAKVKAPIVFAIYGDPTGDGIVDSLAHPGRPLTGLSMANSHLESKRLEVLKEAVPALKRVAILFDPTSSASSAELADAQSGARTLGLEVLVFEMGNPNRFDAVFAEAASRGADGVAAMASAILNFHHTRLLELAMQHRLPAIWESSGYVRDGGLLSYGPNFPDMYRRAAGYVARILNGAKAGDLPVELPTKFELAVNLKTAMALQLALPPTLLTRADEVIE